MTDDAARYPITMCWHCDHALDAATELFEGTATPEPGAISLCLYCGAVATFGPDLILYPPTREELDDLEKDIEFRKMYTQFSWARQYVMIQSNLMRKQREDPDR